MESLTTSLHLVHLDEPRSLPLPARDDGDIREAGAFECCHHIFIQPVTWNTPNSPRDSAVELLAFWKSPSKSAATAPSESKRSSIRLLVHLLEV